MLMPDLTCVTESTMVMQVSNGWPDTRGGALPGSMAPDNGGMARLMKNMLEPTALSFPSAPVTMPVPAASSQTLPVSAATPTASADPGAQSASAASDAVAPSSAVPINAASGEDTGAALHDAGAGTVPAEAATRSTAGAASSALPASVTASAESILSSSSTHLASPVVSSAAESNLPPHVTFQQAAELTARVLPSVPAVELAGSYANPRSLSGPQAAADSHSSLIQGGSTMHDSAASAGIPSADTATGSSEFLSDASLASTSSPGTSNQGLGQICEEDHPAEAVWDEEGAQSPRRSLSLPDGCFSPQSARDMRATASQSNLMQSVRGSALYGPASSSPASRNRSPVASTLYAAVGLPAAAAQMADENLRPADQDLSHAGAVSALRHADGLADGTPERSALQSSPASIAIPGTSPAQPEVNAELVSSPVQRLRQRSRHDAGHQAQLSQHGISDSRCVQDPHLVISQKLSGAQSSRAGLGTSSSISRTLSSCGDMIRRLFRTATEVVHHHA